MGWPFTVLMPIFAAQDFEGGPHTLGFLMAAVGVGALASAVSLAAAKDGVGAGEDDSAFRGSFRRRADPFRDVAKFLALALLMLVCGFGLMQQMAASNTIIQTIVEEGKRGRVMSFYTMAFMGMAPFGSLLAGSACSRHRRATDRDVQRSVLHRRRDLVRQASAADTNARSTDLHGSRDTSAGDRRGRGQRRAVSGNLIQVPRG